MPSIAALLPAYNEEVSIGSVVLRTKQYADRVVVVDDGSSDHTAEVAALAGARGAPQQSESGKGRGFEDGFRGPQWQWGDCHHRHGPEAFIFRLDPSTL